MIKPDKMGYAQLCFGLFLAVLFLAWVFSLQLQSFLTGPKAIGNWVMIVLYTIVTINAIFFLKVCFVGWRNNWHKIEQARLNAQQCPLYEPQPQPASRPLTTLALKKRPRIVDIALRVSMVFFGIGALPAILLIRDNVYAHPPLGSTPVSILLMVGVGIAAFSFLITIIVAGLTMLDGSVEIVAGEHDLLVRTGCVRRRVSWRQVSLFAVGAFFMQMDALHIDTLQWVELSSATVIVRWPNERAPSKRVFRYFMCDTSDGKRGYRRVSKDEYQVASDYLNSYIAQKTGLLLRDVRCIT
ncbi:hypothetical protein KDH_24540 [Dictyobacter sp. S3.2.2.5]|uniref:RDD domain-containing protein n=2 Tax=Dictyobacter halimunensis TaxID=3026934 RepID=A0ABQ6FPK3_9CHLR|nr:hypothetical protein KDH_24540 [Dictyobacter sp. S3.2.2.5]